MTNEALPNCLKYAYYLSVAVEKFQISITEARNKYGLYTTTQWETLLNS